MDPNEANSFGWQEGFAGFAIQNGVARFRPLRWKEVLLRVLSNVSKNHVDNSLHMFAYLMFA